MLGWELPPHNSGGLGVACYQLCKALAEKGADIDFVVPYQAQHDAGFMQVIAAYSQGVAEVISAGNAYNSRAYVLPDGRIQHHDVFGQQHAYEQGVAKLVRKKAVVYDVVHAHDWLTFRAGLRAKLQLGCPLVLHVHSVERDRAGGGMGNPLVREIEGTAFSLADHIVAVSNHTKAMVVADYGVPAANIEVVHNSINPDDFALQDTDNAYHYLSAMRAQGYKVVVNVGRLTLQKGLPNLLRAAQEVIVRVPKTLFLIVGSGEQYAELIEQAASLGIAKNVIFTDFQRGKRWRDAYRIADLFVMPSISEPFGLTALEAVGYGTPVLVSKQSGVAEVLRNSLQVDFWDIHEMANQIAGVVQSPALHQELQRNVKREFDALSWSDAADTLLGVFNRHLSGARI